MTRSQTSAGGNLNLEALREAITPPEGTTLRSLAEKPLPDNVYLMHEEADMGFPPIGGFCIDEMSGGQAKDFHDVLDAAAVRIDPGAAYGTHITVADADPDRIETFSRFVSLRGPARPPSADPFAPEKALQLKDLLHIPIAESCRVHCAGHHEHMELTGLCGRVMDAAFRERWQSVLNADVQRIMPDTTGDTISLEGLTGGQLRDFAREAALLVDQVDELALRIYGEDKAPGELLWR